VVAPISERLHDHCSPGLADEGRHTHTKDIHCDAAEPKDHDAQKTYDEGDHEMIVVYADDVLPVLTKPTVIALINPPLSTRNSAKVASTARKLSSVALYGSHLRRRTM
jgi:hypothetical protein